MKRSILLLSLLFVTSQMFSLDIPKLKGRVNDYAEALSEKEESELEAMLKNYEDTTSTQIVILSIKSLEGEEKADLAQRVGESWGIGQKGKNNGVVILWAIEEKQVFIATGYGMEGVLPDVICKRIWENDMKPYFKDSQFKEGLEVGILKIASAATGEYQKEIEQSKRNGKIFWNIVLIAIIAGILGYFHWSVSMISGAGLIFVANLIGFQMFEWNIIILIIFGGILGFISHLVMSVAFGGGVTGIDPSESIILGSGGSSGSGGSGFGGFTGGGGGFGGGGGGGGY